jgi:NADH-quinone oxidoreductase subunit C
MALAPAIIDLELLKDHPAVAALLAWNRVAVEAAKFDRDETTVWIAAGSIREACSMLRDHRGFPCNFLEDVTCVDWYPSEPRFEVVYHLLSMAKKERVRLKVKLASGQLTVPSITSVWPSANFPEREVFDLFGIRFEGHPYLRRIMMPEDWEGHPLRKDFPVEGYR